MIRKSCAALMALGLAACASMDRSALTEFEPLEGDRFRYEVSADTIRYPLEDPDAEATRMTWLESYLADNGLCSGGYEILDRKAVIIQDSALARSWRVYYTGACL